MVVLLADEDWFVGPVDVEGAEESGVVLRRVLGGWPSFASSLSSASSAGPHM